MSTNRGNTAAAAVEICYVTECVCRKECEKLIYALSKHVDDAIVSKDITTLDALSRGTRVDNGREFSE